METMIKNLGERMIILMRAVNLFGITDPNKLTHELSGMCMALRAMNIEFEFEFNDDVTQYTAISINGTKFDV